jgi:hypothetical protein
MTNAIVVYNYFMADHEIVNLSTTTAFRLTPRGTHSGMDITLQSVNLFGYVYIGGEGVTSSNYGYRLMPNHAISFELPGQDALYAIASDENMNLAVLKTHLEIQG